MPKYTGINDIIWNKILFNVNNPILYNIKFDFLNISNWNVKYKIPVKCITINPINEYLMYLVNEKLFFLFNILIIFINGNIPIKYPKLGVIKYPNDPPSKNIGKKNKPINI